MATDHPTRLPDDDDFPNDFIVWGYETFGDLVATSRKEDDAATGE